MTSALLVAEESESRALIVQELSRAGYVVTVVSTSREANELLKIGYPNLIVWWIGRPTVDDLRLARVVKHREATAPLPIIYLHGPADARMLLEKLAGLRG